MYIYDFFHSLIFLQPSDQFFDEDFLADKYHVQVIHHSQLTENVSYHQKANFYLIYTKQENSKRFYAHSLDALYQYIKQLSGLKITIPASQAIYLEAGILEAIYLYDYLLSNSLMNSYSHLLLPLSYLDNLFCGCPQNNKNDYPQTYHIECLQQLYILRFYYFIIQYCYNRFQCQQHLVLTHPYHFDILVQNKLTQYLKVRPIKHIQDLTFLDNPILDQYIHSLQNDS